MAETKAGRRCRAWAMRGSEKVWGEPRCAAHGGRSAEMAPRSDGGVVVSGAGLYSAFFSDGELRALASAGEVERSLEGEIVYARVFLRRLLALATAQPEMRLGELVKLTPVVGGLLRTVGYLVHEDRAGDDEAEDPMEAMMTEVLAELSDEWEIDLVGDGRVYEKEGVSDES